MRTAIYGLIVNYLYFFVMGLGPLLLLCPETPAGTLAALAPTLGYALVSLGLTLVLLHGATIAGALVPLTLGGLLLGLACAAVARIDWRAFLAGLTPRGHLPALTGGLLVLVLSTAPLASGTLTYATFRGNAGDSFIYMLIGNFLDATPRQVAFRESEAELAARSPLLAPVRDMLSIRWTSGAMLDFTARIAGSDVLAFQYPCTLLSMLLLYAVLLPFLAALGLPPWWAAATGLALATGFYGQFVLDIRAFSQINTLPVIVFLAYILARPPGPGLVRAGRRMLLAGICWLAVFVNYTEIFPMTLAAVLAWLGLKFLTRRLSLREVGLFLGGLALGLAGTTSVSFLYGHLARQIHFSGEVPAMWSVAYFTWLYDHILVGAAGLSLAIQGFSRVPGLAWLNQQAQPAITALVTGLAASMVGLFVVACARVLRERDPEADFGLMALSFGLASLAAFGLFLFLGRPWVAGKSLSYFYPFFLALPLAWPFSLSRSRIRGLAKVLVALYLGLQIAFAGLRPVYAALDANYPRYVWNHGRYRCIDLTMAPLRRALVRAKAREVAVCSADPWKAVFASLDLTRLARPQELSRVLARGGEAYVVLDRPLTGVPAGLAPFALADNSSFVLYRLPHQTLAGLAAGLTCAKMPE